MIKDNLIFLREFLREFQSTGTIWPTSKWAAEALTSPLRSRNGHGPFKILEIGPGTGSVTTHILEHMQPGDEFTICEINPRFLKALREKLSENEFFQKKKDNVHFFEGPVQNLPENGKFDLIVCAIPFLNLDLPTVEEIFSKLGRISREDTLMTYYEYIGLREIGKMMSPRQRKERLKQLDSFFKGLFDSHLAGRKKVWLNILPINIYTLENIDDLQVAA